MSSTIIDETVILRYLLDDDEVLSPRAAKVIATRTARVYPEIKTAGRRLADFPKMLLWSSPAGQT